MPDIIKEPKFVWTEKERFLSICPEMARLSNVFEKKTKEKFGMRPEIVVSLHRQSDK